MFFEKMNYFLLKEFDYIFKHFLNSMTNFQIILYLISIVFLIFIVLKCYSILYCFSDEFRAMNDTRLERIESINRNTDKSPNYPNGWIPILESHQLKVNQIKPVIAFGYELVAFRGPSGESHIIDAFCPHLGAHFGIGAKVGQTKCGKDSIECPFHGWTFRSSDGQCVDIPEMESNEVQSVKAMLKIWKCIEINDLIYVWYDSEDREPNWKPDVISDIQNKKLVCLGRTEYRINCHIQEIISNSFDLAHFPVLHKPLCSPKNPLNIIQKFLQKIINYGFEVKRISMGEPKFYQSTVIMETFSKICGYETFPHELTLNQLGPANNLYIRYNTSDDGLVIQYAHSIGPNNTKCVFLNYSGSGFKSRLFSKMLHIMELRMVERDMYIWNNMRYMKNAKLTKNEKSITQFRRWYSGFYSDIKV